MNYRETYNVINKNVIEEIRELAKPYTEEEPKDIDFLVCREGILGDWELEWMYWDEEQNEAFFYIKDDDDPVALWYFDLDTKIDILDYLKSLN